MQQVIIIIMKVNLDNQFTDNNNIFMFGKYLLIVMHLLWHIIFIHDHVVIMFDRIIVKSKIDSVFEQKIIVSNQVVFIAYILEFV